MKVTNVIPALAVFILLFSICTFLWCNQKPAAKEVDIVNDIEPVHEWEQSQNATLDVLKYVAPSLRMQYIDNHWPSLKDDVVAHVRHLLPTQQPTADSVLRPIATVDSVVFIYGSGKGVANDKHLKKFKGVFKDQLLAAIYLKADTASPYLFFVRCLNGLSEPVAKITKVGTSRPDYEILISEGQGLCDRVGVKKAIDIARLFELPLYRGKIIKPQYKISYDQAERLAAKNEKITVLVYSGDYINLREMTYNGKVRRLVWF